jgi:cytochrome P450
MPCPRSAASAGQSHRLVTGAPGTAAPCTGAGRSDPAGVVHIRDFTAARAVLRSRHSVQAGFGADVVSTMPLLGNLPMVYQDGEVHHRQRRSTARLFTPAVVEARYRLLMERQAAALAAELVRRKRLDVTELSTRMTVEVGCQVLGLTNSLIRRGLPGRVDRLLAMEVAARGWRPGQLLKQLRMQRPAFSFFLLDVLPALLARRRRRGSGDLITHLLDQGRNWLEVYTECATFCVAAVVTTREFISLALWQLLDRPALAARYRAAGQRERLAILQEILRLEPVTGHLFRRPTADIPLDPAAPLRVAPRGALVVIHLHDVNADPAAVGSDPLLIRPARPLAGTAVPADVMSLGDGHHRCPGGSLALQEADVLLRRLLALPGLRILNAPRLDHNQTADSYQLRNFTLAVN